MDKKEMTEFDSVEEQPVAKIKAKVINILENNLILEDENGNGIRILITKEYRKAKIGDTLFL
jgi:hypothetical protein